MNKGPDWLTWAIRAGAGLLLVWALDRIEGYGSRLTKIESEQQVIMQYLFDNPHRSEDLPRRGRWEKWPAP